MNIAPRIPYQATLLRYGKVQTISNPLSETQHLMVQSPQLSHHPHFAPTQVYEQKFPTVLYFDLAPPLIYSPSQ
jgi:hypothetical protein